MRFRSYATVALLFGSSLPLAHGISISVPGDYLTIQEAIDASSAGDTIVVDDGTYTETLTIDKTLNLVAEDGATPSIEGRVNIDAADVLVEGFTITNPNDSFGLIVGAAAPADNAVITGNIFLNIGTGAETGQTQSVWVNEGDGVEISFNAFDGVYAGTGGGSAKAVLISQSVNPDVSGALVYANTMSNISAPAGGAYGVQVAGPAPDVSIRNNIISDLTGSWGHGISLDNDTLNATIERNEISDVTGTATGFGVGLNLENNTQITTIAVVENNFALLPASVNVGILNQDTTVTVNAENNWWGDASGPADPAGTFETSVGNCSGAAASDANADGTGAAAPGTDFHPLAGYIDYCPWATQPFDVVVLMPGPPPPPESLGAAGPLSLFVTACLVFLSGLVVLARKQNFSIRPAKR